ncbi:MAG: hypothetical protein NZ853_02125 [Leptospiraceae bacterium]|nr:hypothetical protein [Leptospiraceae bacterium]MDW7975977.1 hypothetical protein [Leptospiraceae bacterium]
MFEFDIQKIKKAHLIRKIEKAYLSLIHVLNDPTGKAKITLRILLTQIDKSKFVEITPRDFQNLTDLISKNLIKDYVIMLIDEIDLLNVEQLSTIAYIADSDYVKIGYRKINLTAKIIWGVTSPNFDRSTSLLCKPEFKDYFVVLDYKE